MRSKISELLGKINPLANSSLLTANEIDLLKQYTRDLYEAVILLQQQEPEKEKPVIKEVKKEKPVTVPSPISEKEEKVISKKRTSINESLSPAGSLNETLKPVSKTELHHQLSIKPLKELINMNKRFVLVKELFGGNSDAFAQAVSDIDAAADYEEAETYIKTELFVKHNWGETAQPTRLFIKLVKQKFGIE
jgi:hypothetical protein